MVIGNLAFVGYHGLEYLKSSLIIEILAEIGVILLLFQVGLESKVEEMLSVGVSSFLVAVLGVIAPFVLGFVVSMLFLSDASVYVHIYVGTVLCATSVGITARVLQDLGKIQTKEARIVLGAAVIDDIMGLVVLAVVVGIIKAADIGATLNPLGVLVIILKAIGFFAGALVIGVKFSPSLFKVASFLRVKGMLLTTALTVCFILAWLADRIGLAPIVGAFAAGLVMEPIHFRDFTSRGEGHLEELLAPIGLFLIPIFFVRMGLEVDLTAFGNVSVLGFAFALTMVAIIGKQVCSLGVVEKGLDKISVGVGMIPRGEVGLIVAAIGTRMTLGGERVITDSTFSAAVIMVIITTMVTPPILKLTLARGEKLKTDREGLPVFATDDNP
jgi:Kef-type K+ transport system membrane component KefB